MSALVKTELDVVLEMFNLTKETLTNDALRKQYMKESLKVNPNGTRYVAMNAEEKAAADIKFRELGNAYDALRAFTSLDVCEDLHKDASVAATVDAFLGKVAAKEDQDFLFEQAFVMVSDALNTTDGYSKDGEYHAFHNAAGHMLQTLHDLHAKGKLDLKTSMTLLSRTASLIKNPQEHRAFFQAAKPFDILLHPLKKLGAWMMILAGHAAKLVSLNTLGDAWIKKGHETLDQIDGLSKFVGISVMKTPAPSA